MANEALMTAFRTRFAPSPTGYLHAGHGYSACLAHRMTRTAHGQFLLRIEDIDATRCRLAFEQAIIDDLRWLGVDWDEPPLRQSDRRAIYDAALAQLHHLGVVYRCFKTRRDLADAASAPHRPVAIYRGAPLSADDEAQHLATGHPYAWRLSVPAAWAVLGRPLSFHEDGPLHWGQIAITADDISDVVVARRDLGVAYHLAVVVDDAASAITHVVRGADLFDSTPVHVLLQALLGYDTPRYHHHALILDAGGERLAKRRGSETLRDLRARGVTPDAIAFPAGMS